MKPRVDRALRDVGGEFRMLVRSIAWDYKATHVATFEPVPNTSLGVLDHWLANVDREDRARPAHGDDDLPLVVTSALNAATSLRRARDNDKDVLEPEVVAAIDEFEEDARLAFSVYYGMPDASRGDRAREGIRLVVRGARNLGETLIRQDRQWLDEGPVIFARSGSWGTELETTNPPPPRRVSNPVLNRTPLGSASGIAVIWYRRLVPAGASETSSRRRRFLPFDPLEDVPAVVPAVAAELDVRQVPGTRVLPNPALRHREQLSDLFGSE
jgi:hypothetical protein